MKQIIIILATVLLGIYIGGTLINGSGEDSLRGSVETIAGSVDDKLDTVFPK